MIYSACRARTLWDKLPWRVLCCEAAIYRRWAHVVVHSRTTAVQSTRSFPPVHITYRLHLREGCEVLWWVCLFVCPSVRSRIPKTTQPIFTKFVLNVVCGSGSVLLWRSCDMLCTSGFMDDVMFSHSGLYDVSCVYTTTVLLRSL